MRGLLLAKRNLTELIRDPLASVFFAVFPALLFAVLEGIMLSFGDTVLAATPQFTPSHMVAGMIVFSFSFITIFVSITVSQDRESSLLMRLKISPLRPFDFVLGYTLPFVPIALVQEILMIVIGFAFKMTPSLGILLMGLALFPVAFLFIGIGLLFGTLLNSKACGPLSSIAPTFAALLGGMFFPLDSMAGPFKTICYVFPFANAITFGNDLILEKTPSYWMFGIVFGYAVFFYFLATVIFSLRLKSDSI